jgi:murein DD-endopeptidase MepM/ murein hydrolase activator NlpD
MSTPRRSLALSLIALLALTTAACVAAPPAPTTTTLPLSDAAVVKAITFPVSGGARYADTFGAPRSGGRQHAGQDLMGTKGTPLVAAVDGVVTRLRHDTSGLSGNSLTIRGDDGWTYHYMHLNNDSPGTDDGLNPFGYAFAPGLTVNTRVSAGQLVAYLGDSGNAEDAGAHLHFEIHMPDGTAINAFASLRAATAAPVLPRPW